MLKEERELRKYIFGPEHPMNASIVRSMITDLVRAVRADERKRCTNVSKGMVKYGGNRYSDSYNRACEEIAAAIRARK
jgi:hypothetical protein